MHFPDIAVIAYKELHQECWNNYIVVTPRKDSFDIEPNTSISVFNKILETISERHGCSITAINNAIHVFNNLKIGNFFSVDGTVGRNHFNTEN